MTRRVITPTPEPDRLDLINHKRDHILRSLRERAESYSPGNWGRPNVIVLDTEELLAILDQLDAITHNMRGGPA